MKKTFIILASLAVFAACGGDGDSEKKEETKKEEAAPAVADNSSNPDYQKGLEIASKSDCMTCHKIDEKNIGPAWRDVANKYAGQDTAVRYLAQKIIDGGSGVWGTVPMAPHPTFTKEEAEAVAKYVLLLKSNQ
ncbi:MAG TPA: c-type cytochrome [Chitinophagaceae bacterium]|nr:c-type cytochrome [Chitinophagaceae bacterium]